MRTDGCTDLTGLRINGVPVLPFGLPKQSRPDSKHFYLDIYSGNDAYNGRSPNQAFKTLARAYGAMVSGRGDTLHVLPYVDPTTGATSNGFGQVIDAVDEYGLVPVLHGGAVWAKNNCHIVGDAIPGQNPRSSIRLATTDVLTTNLFTVSGSDCYFENIGWQQGSTLATAQVCLTITGQRNLFLNCAAQGFAVANATRTTVSGDRSLVFDGGGVQNGENLWIGGQIGVNTVPRGNVACAEIEAKGAAARNIILGALVATQALTGGTNANLFVLVGAGGLQDWLIIANSWMLNNAWTSGAGLMAKGVNVSATAGGALVLPRTQIGGVVAGALQVTNNGNVLVDGVGGAATGARMIVATG
jgi:hypothetical protein